MSFQGGRRRAACSAISLTQCRRGVLKRAAPVLMPHLDGSFFGELQMSAEKLFISSLPFQLLMLPFKLIKSHFFFHSK